MKIISHLKYYLTPYCFALASNLIAQTNMESIKMEDREKLSKLNSLFIKNFIAQDTVMHNEIIHKDFVCIEGDGKITTRNEYMKTWVTDYQTGKFTSFSITDEHIRIFGNMALVRSKTVYTRIQDAKEVSGNSLYTDTYIKENDRWWCVQAQITPIKGAK